MTIPEPFDPSRIERPDPALFRYYLWTSLLTGPMAPLVLAPLWFRFISLRYKFDETGVSMTWGILFRREVYLTYRRIQDIHLTRNILQRWMGLATISLQTASGSSQAEMAIEGVLQADQLRDYLYGQMRGARNERDPSSSAHRGLSPAVSAEPNDVPSADRATRVLEEIRDALQKLVARKKQVGDQ